MSQPDAARERLWRVAALALAAAWWLIDLGGLGTGVPAPLDDTWEYGVIARHLLAGDGFRTGVIHPPLWGLRDAALSVPMLVHGPVIPLLLVPLVAVFGPRALDGMPWLAAAFAFAAAALLYRVVARRTGPIEAATCVALFTLSPLTLQAVHHDASCAIGACLLVAAIDALESARVRPVVAGLLAGLGALARPELGVAGLVLGATARQGVRARFFAALVAPLVAWTIYRGVTTGMPFFNLSSYLLLADTSRYPELSALRSFELTPDHFGSALRGALASLPAKWAHALPRAAKHGITAPAVTTGWLAALAVGFTLWRLGRRHEPRSSEDASPLLGRDVLLMAIPIALLVLTERRPTLLVSFLPVWCWAVTRGLSAVLWRSSRVPGVAYAVLVLLALPSGVIAMRDAATEAALARSWLARERVALLERYGPPGPEPLATPGARARPAVVFSDTPDWVAWSTGLPSVWITRDELGRLEQPGTTWPEGLPRPGAGAGVWFHEDARRYR